jgi:2',3'-cyclic-nucleotide 2'-phosphodiesterase (5'-nucleotidase family)
VNPFRLPTRRSGRCFVPLLLALCLLAPAWASSARLVILHTNDLHDRVRAGDQGQGGLPYVSGYIRQVRAERSDVLALDAGDVAEKGDLVAFRTHSVLTYEALGRIGYDAVTIGNHDHESTDYTWLHRYEQAMGRPFVCLNLLDRSGAPAFAPSRIVERNGLKVGIIGLIVPRQEQCLDHAESGRALAREAVRLRAAGVHLVIALCHEGTHRCTEWARAAPEVQVFVSGHTHEVLAAPVVVPETGALIVQAGCYARFVGRLELEVDLATRKIVRSAGALVPMQHDRVPVDGTLLALVREREQALAPEATEPVFANPAEVGGAALARLAAEGLRRATGADAAFCHPYQVIRDTLPPGKIDVNALFRTGGQRGHENVLVELTGTQIEAYMNALLSVQKEPPEWTGFRVTAVTAAGGEQYRVELEPQQRYRVVMPRIEWETRFLRLANRMREQNPRHPLATHPGATTPVEATFTSALRAYINVLLVEGDTVQARAEQLARLRRN